MERLVFNDVLLSSVVVPVGGNSISYPDLNEIGRPGRTPIFTVTRVRGGFTRAATCSMVWSWRTDFQLGQQQRGFTRPHRDAPRIGPHPEHNSNVLIANG